MCLTQSGVKLPSRILPTAPLGMSIESASLCDDESLVADAAEDSLDRDDPSLNGAFWGDALALSFPEIKLYSIDAQPSKNSTQCTPSIYRLQYSIFHVV